MGMPTVFRAAATACLLLIAAAPPLYAQTPGTGAAQVDPERLAAARELVAATKSDGNPAALLSEVFALLRSSAAPASPEAQKARAEVIAEIEKQFEARLGELLDRIAFLYAQHFTTEELRAATTFYRTGTGQKFVAVLPHLFAEEFKMGMEWSRTISLEAEQRIREEMRRRGFNP
jgi:uncharacterized protein